MKFVRLFDSRFIAFAFLGENVQQHRLLLRLQKLKCPDQQRDIVPIDRPIVTQSKFLEDDARHNKGLDAFFDLMRELRYGFAGNRPNEIARFVVQMRKRWTGRDAV